MLHSHYNRYNSRYVVTILRSIVAAKEADESTNIDVKKEVWIEKEVMALLTGHTTLGVVP